MARQREKAPHALGAPSTARWRPHMARERDTQLLHAVRVSNWIWMIASCGGLFFQSRPTPRGSQMLREGTRSRETRREARMAQERAKVTQFVHALINWCWMVSTSAGLFFLAFTISLFAPVDPKLKTPAMASVSAEDELKDGIATCTRFLLAFLFAGVYLIVMAKQRVDASIKAADLVASEEAKAYKAALDEQSVARTAVNDAADEYLNAARMFPPPALGAQDPLVLAASNAQREAILALRNANEKVEEMKPLIGLARMGVVERRIVRGLFVLAILFSFAAATCAFVAFYKSLQLQMHNPMCFQTFAMFSVPAVPMVMAHLNFLHAALCKD